MLCEGCGDAMRCSEVMRAEMRSEPPRLSRSRVSLVIFPALRTPAGDAYGSRALRPLAAGRWRVPVSPHACVATRLGSIDVRGSSDAPFANATSRHGKP